MIKKWGFAIIALGILFTACKNDDDVRELPVEEQNDIDDRAIVEYLQNHYFDPEKGLIKEFDAGDPGDDNYATLHSQGIKLPSGVWIVKKPGVVAEGRIAQDNTKDSILISHEIRVFKASYENLTGEQKPYKSIQTIASTINGSGTAIWDPSYYFYHIPSTMNDNVNLSHFVVEGFTEGLKQFNSTQTSGADLYNFQGAIIVPSRAAFGRDFVYSGSALNYAYRDFSFVFNFELHKVIDRIP